MLKFHALKHFAIACWDSLHSLVYMFLLSMQRITIPEIIENEWFQQDYVPTYGNDSDEKIYLDDVNAAFDSIEVKAPHDCSAEKNARISPSLHIHI